MLKFIIILLIIIALILLGLSALFKKVRNLFDINQYTQNAQNNKKNDDDIVYRKDDVVVLKGEAKKNKDNRDKK